MKRIVRLVLTLIFAGGLGIAIAQKPAVVLKDEPGWQKIGETVASFKSQNESIVVMGADEFSAIKLKVKDAPLNIDRMQVFYESGEMEEINVRQRIEAGNETNVFKLKHERDIRKVAFTYNTLPNDKGEKADVELLGLKKADREDKASDAYRDRDDKLERDAEEAEEDVEREAEEAEEKMERKAEKTGDDVENTADKTGNEIAETAAEVAADIDDKKVKNKVGPEGQTIFVNDEGEEKDPKYYYINEEGRKVSITPAQMKDKPKDDND